MKADPRGLIIPFYVILEIIISKSTAASLPGTQYVQIIKAPFELKFYYTQVIRKTRSTVDP